MAKATIQRRHRLGGRRPPLASKTQRIVQFMNTPLGLWFLSSVLLGIITFTYTSLSETQRQRRQRIATRNDVAFEIAVRIETARSLTRIANHRRMMNDKNWLKSMTSRRESPATPWQIMNRSGVLNAPAVAIGLPQFRDRSLKSLYWQLLPLVSSQEQSAVRRKLVRLARLEHLQRKSPIPPPAPRILREPTSNALWTLLSHDLSALGLEDLRSMHAIVAVASMAPEDVLLEERLDKRIRDYPHSITEDAPQPYVTRERGSAAR